jgi:hypothetical protein
MDWEATLWGTALQTHTWEVNMSIHDKAKNANESAQGAAKEVVVE